MNAVLQLNSEVITFQNDNRDLGKNGGVGETAGVVSTVLRNRAFDWEDAEDSLTRPGVLYSGKGKFQDVSTVLRNCAFDWEDAEDSLTHPWILYSEKRKNFKTLSQSSVIFYCTHEWENAEDSLTRPGVLYPEKRKNFKMFLQNSVIALLTETTLRPAWSSMCSLPWKKGKFQDFSTVLCDCTLEWADAEDSLTIHELFTLKKMAVGIDSLESFPFLLKSLQTQALPYL